MRKTPRRVINASECFGDQELLRTLSTELTDPVVVNATFKVIEKFPVRDTMFTVKQETPNKAVLNWVGFDNKIMFEIINDRVYAEITYQDGTFRKIRERNWMDFLEVYRI